MRILSVIIALWASLVLSGCASTAQSSSSLSLAKYLVVQEPRGPESTSNVFEFDSTRDAGFALDIRTNWLFRKDLLVAGVRNACSRGVSVNVLLSVSGGRSANALAGTCAAIYLSDNPDLRAEHVVVVQDEVILVVDGMWKGTRSRERIAAQQELAFQRSTQRNARRIQ